MKRTLTTLVISLAFLLVFAGCKGIPQLKEGFGIYDSLVELTGVYSGWEDTIPLTIVNGNDRDRLFTVSVKSPSKVREGFEAFPEKYFHWFTILEPRISIPAGNTHQVPIVLAIPNDANYSKKRAEVRILVENVTQSESDLVQIEIEARWFIITE